MIHMKHQVHTEYVGSKHWEYVHALEDYPEKDQKEIKALLVDERVVTHLNNLAKADWEQRGLPDSLMVPSVDEHHARMIWDICENVTAISGGEAEEAASKIPGIAQLFDRIRLSKLTHYTYRVSDRLVRGARPDKEKLIDLYDAWNIRSTINLCEEMHYGDDPILEAAKLTGKVKSAHFPMIDNRIPGPEDTVGFFEFLRDPHNLPAYVHCEQGIGRTGMMTAAYRIAFNGWNAVDAGEEAKRFGDGLPDQQDFISDFADDMGSDSSLARALRKLGVTGEEEPTAPRDQLTRNDCIDPPRPG